MLLEGSEHALTRKTEVFEAGDEEDDDKSCSIKQVLGGKLLL